MCIAPAPPAQLLSELGGVIILEYTSGPATPGDGPGQTRGAASAEAEEALSGDDASRNSIWSAVRRGQLMRRLSFLGQDLGPPGFLSPPTTRRSVSAPLRASPSPARSASPLPNAAAEPLDGWRPSAATRGAAPTPAPPGAAPGAAADADADAATGAAAGVAMLHVAVRLAGQRGAPCVRVPIRRAWAWGVCLAEVRLRLLEAAVIGESVRVTALRAAAPPHARVVRTADLAPGEVLEALLDGSGEAPPASLPALEAALKAEAAPHSPGAAIAGGSAAEASPWGSARQEAETPRAVSASPGFGVGKEVSNLFKRKHTKRDVVE